MSRTEKRRLAAIGAAALALRLAIALVTQTRPLFPAFYYTDAVAADSAAAAVIGARPATPSVLAFIGNLSQLVQVQTQVAVYRVVGPRPFAMKLLNCLFGALAVVALGLGFSAAFGAAPALAAAAACALWPSYAFYTSQNFKEGPTNLLAYLALALLLALLTGGAARLAGAAFLCLLGAGFYRAHVLLTLSCAAALAFLAAAALKRSLPKPLATGLAAAILAPALYLPLSRWTMSRYQSQFAVLGDSRLAPQLLPLTYDSHTSQVYSPTSPRGLTAIRRTRQEADQVYARAWHGREIATQLFPEARFESWLDVLAFLPKSAFYALFMPLPGLYPLEGKLGRLLASLENLALLALAGLGLAGAARGPKTPARALPLLFFAAMAAGSALLEFDLGSAGRHKLLYLPMLFPFAAEEALRLLGRGKSA